MRWWVLLCPPRIGIYQLSRRDPLRHPKPCSPSTYGAGVVPPALLSLIPPYCYMSLIHMVQKIFPPVLNLFSWVLVRGQTWPRKWRDSMLNESSWGKSSSMDRSLVLHNVVGITMKGVLSMVGRNNKRYENMMSIRNSSNFSPTLIPKRQHLLSPASRDSNAYHEKDQFLKFRN